jgi:hypothetical protein
MSNLIWLTDAQMARLEPLFPKSRGKPRGDDRHVLSGIIFINRNRNRNGLRWCDASSAAWPSEDLLQPLEAMGRQGHLRPDDGRSGLLGRRSEDGDD